MVISLLKKFTATRFFPTIGISGLATAKRLITQPAKEISRAVGETIAGLSIAFPPARALAIKTLVPATAKGKVAVVLGAPLVTGILAGSKRAREFALGLLDPVRKFERGKEIGGIIEEPSKLLPKKKVPDILKTTGLIGTGAAIATAIPIVTEKIRGARAPVITPTGTLAGVPVQAITQQAPISAIPKEIPKEKVVEPVKQALPSIINKISVRPEIDIRFSKRKTFINQQILLN